MGTRGLFGFIYKGVRYIMYKHFDCYPCGLGAEIVEQLLKALEEGRLYTEWIDKLDALRIVDEDGDPPTKEDIEALADYTNLGVGEGCTDDWYCLTHKLQGSLEDVLESGYLLTGILEKDVRSEKGWKSRVCGTEYAYVVNLDKKVLEFHNFSDRRAHISLTPEALADWIEPYKERERKRLAPFDVAFTEDISPPKRRRKTKTTE